MARLPALIDLIVSFGDVERKTVDGQARALRDAGMITPSKRGVGAAHITFDDAAILLLASMCTNSITFSPGISQQYAKLSNAFSNNMEGDLFLLPNIKREILMYYPLYYASTALDALKIMIKQADKCWNFCDYDTIQGREIAFDFNNRQVSVTLNTTHRAISVEIKDLYTTELNQTRDLSAQNMSKIFANKTQFRMTWADFRNDKSQYDDRPRRTSAVTVSGEALYELNQLVKAA